MDHVMASFSKAQELEAFRAYVCEGVRILTENTAHIAGGSMLSVKYDDLVHPKKHKEELKADKVIANIKKKLGG